MKNLLRSPIVIVYGLVISAMIFICVGSAFWMMGASSTSVFESKAKVVIESNADEVELAKIEIEEESLEEIRDRQGRGNSFCCPN